MTAQRIFHRLNERKPQVEKLYAEGITRGKYLGWENLHELFSLKPQGTTYIYSAPFSGKSEFWFDVMVYLSENYGWYHAIYSPETGEGHDIYAELISKYVQKPFHKNIPGFMTEQERERAADFVHEHFVIIEPQEGKFTIEDFYKMVGEIEKHYCIKINTTCIDPFNEVDHDFSAEDGRQDVYLENKLGFIRKDAISNHRHNVVITHVRDQGHPVVKDGLRYYPPASPREIAGGQAWFRKAMNMLCLWRPPKGLLDESGMPAEENEVWVMIQKYKPKGVGKRGTAKLYFDSHRNRFYEMLNNEKRYAGKQLETNPYATQYEF